MICLSLWVDLHALKYSTEKNRTDLAGEKTVFKSNQTDIRRGNFKLEDKKPLTISISITAQNVNK